MLHVSTRSGSRYELDVIERRIRCANRPITVRADAAVPKGEWVPLLAHGPIRVGYPLVFFAVVGNGTEEVTERFRTSAVTAIDVPSWQPTPAAAV